LVETQKREVGATWFHFPDDPHSCSGDLLNSNVKWLSSDSIPGENPAAHFSVMRLPILYANFVVVVVEVVVDVVAVVDVVVGQVLHTTGHTVRTTSKPGMSHNPANPLQISASACPPHS
jgi:hypothetical protein